VYKLSRGEICVANFMLPANGGSLGDKLLFKAKFIILEKRNSKRSSVKGANIFLVWFCVNEG
jgi:hypothetical protein